MARDRDELDAIVVGSGFGGAVAVTRLAQAGLRVAILERGERWPRGSFPRDASDFTSGWIWHEGHGLYDVRWLDRMLSVQGAGWGGGSLVYANVFARPPEETFRPHWPAGYSRASLDRYYDLAAYMLEVRPVQPDPATGEVPLRTLAMEDLVRRMDHAAGSVRPNLAVRFADPDRPEPNRHGVLQHGCSFVGECVIGCNQGAKNSLDYNYLAVAERAGAVVRTRCEVVRIEPADTGYTVTYTDHGNGRAEQRLTARTLFLAAGAVGTTELLLRARDADKTLPDLSRRLGEGFSGNGDYLTMIRRARVPLDPERGPTITTTSIVDFDEAEGRQVWFQVQDGNYPTVLGRLFATIDPTRHLRARLARRLPARRRTRSRSAPLSLLLMGRDTSQGRLVLDHKQQASLAWDNRANRDLYVAEGQVGRAVARMLGGRALTAPTWSLMRRALTVHNLGGVPMGRGASDGVIDEHGEVHGYPGLFVVDGAAVPSATGVNPSASILAMAERNVERVVRRLVDDPNWEAPEMASVTPADVPEDRAMRRMSEQRHQRSGNGVRFSEVLAGTLHSVDGSRAARLTLTAGVLGIAPFLRDPVHPVSIAGTAQIDGLATDAPVSGTLELFPDAGDVAMRYRLTGTDDAGRPLTLTGTKTQHPRNPLWLWSDLTTLQVQSSAGSGVLRISPVQTVRLGLSIRGQAFTWLKRRKAEVRFLRFFAGRAISGLGWPTRRRPVGSPGRGPR
ncbi:MAG TPA: GMC family oxidoreductase [Propionibacteriaceae bacterium]|nr:GMC family oxidoreductase [Propionibacteriaceae bacterium]